MKVQMDRVRYLSLPQATPTGRMIDQHEAILDAVAAHDPGRVEAAIRTHLTEILNSLPQMDERYPELFEDAENNDRTAEKRPCRSSAPATSSHAPAATSSH